ncbi:MAG: phosphoglucosamine mutase [Euryarchaeota archaeon]|nr:phosphoglucosamine mutase [Euryarchaeota archaeon]
MGLFGSSGIRGKVFERITPELSLKVGLAVGAAHKRVVVGRDTRTSGPMLENALVSGLLSAGAQVRTCGVVTTPTLAYAARDFDCGVVVTASHNPGEYNGIKLWNPDGMAFSVKQQEEVERRVAGEPAHGPWRDSPSPTDNPGAVERHMKALLRDALSANGTKVVVDSGNGPGATITPEMLRRMGASVVTLNAQLDGTFPARDPEPTPENLKDLSLTVTASGAALGIAHDGDADRMVAVDETGTVLGGDLTLALFARSLGARTIVVPIDTSMAVDSFLKGVKVIKGRVGDQFISEDVKAHGASFGGEPSGAWIFPRVSLCPDGPHAAKRMVEIVTREGPLSKVAAEFPSLPIKRHAVKVPEGDKAKTMRHVKELASRLGRTSSIDGVRVDLEDGWLLIRPSGTEPKIRITAEAKTEKRMEDIFTKASDILDKAVKA